MKSANGRFCEALSIGFEFFQVIDSSKSHVEGTVVAVWYLSVRMYSGGGVVRSTDHDKTRTTPGRPYTAADALRSRPPPDTSFATASDPPVFATSADTFAKRLSLFSSFPDLS